MRDTQESSRGNRDKNLSGAGDMESTEASAWKLMTMEWRNASRILLGFVNWDLATTISGGRTVTIDRPDGSSHWIATIVR